MKYFYSTLYLAVVGSMLFLIYMKLPIVRGVEPTKTRDVYFIYEDASTLARGENPYSRIEDGDLHKNRKYTFYLPGFLSAAALSIRLTSFKSYEDWMGFWIPASFVCHVAIGLILFLYCFRRWGLVLAMIGSSFWWFSRWPLSLLRSGQIDNVGILFFVLACLLYERERISSLILLGVSLAIKQMAAFTVPIFLGHSIIYNSPLHSLSRIISRRLLLIMVVPLLLSLPFIIWDFESFFRMLIFPLTRDPSGARSVEYFLGAEGLLGKVPFFGLLFFTYWYTLRKQSSFFAPILLVMLIFLSFNPVFFSRYFCWAVPLIPLALFECFESHPEQGYS